jgi:hypothetical protein
VVWAFAFATNSKSAPNTVGRKKRIIMGLFG